MNNGMDSSSRKMENIVYNDHGSFHHRQNAAPLLKQQPLMNDKSAQIKQYVDHIRQKHRQQQQLQHRNDNINNDMDDRIMVINNKFDLAKSSLLSSLEPVKSSIIMNLDSNLDDNDKQQKRFGLKSDDYHHLVKESQSEQQFVTEKNISKPNKNIQVKEDLSMIKPTTIYYSNNTEGMMIDINRINDYHEKQKLENGNQIKQIIDQRKNGSNNIRNTYDVYDNLEGGSMKQQRRIRKGVDDKSMNDIIINKSDLSPSTRMIMIMMTTTTTTTTPAAIETTTPTIAITSEANDENYKYEWPDQRYYHTFSDINDHLKSNVQMNKSVNVVPPTTNSTELLSRSSSSIIIMNHDDNHNTTIATTLQ